MTTAMYATLASLRAYLSQVPAGAPEDALLTSVLTRATDIVRNAFRAALADPTFDLDAAVVSSARLVTGAPGRTLTIPPHTLGSVTLIEREIATDPLTYTTITDTWQETETGRVYRPAGWWYDRYRVTAEWGYGATPPAVEELTLEVAVNLWRAKDQGGYSETTGIDGQGAVRVIAGLNRQQQQMAAALVASLWQVSV